MSYHSDFMRDQKDDTIAELRRDLKMTNAMLALLENDDTTAIKISIALGNENYIEYWVDDNKNVVNLLKAERRLINNKLNKELES